MNRAFAWGWLVILAALFGYELIAIKTRDWTLTRTTVEYVPWWIVMPFLTWLWLHFLLRYLRVH